MGRMHVFDRRSLREALDGFRGEVKFHEPLAVYTSLQIGGPADALVIPSDVDDLKRLVRQAILNKVPLLVLGGTNVLVRDKGVRGIVIQLAQLNHIRREANHVLYAQAGARMPTVLGYAIRHRLSGFEWAAGIPGTVGGGVVTNAGTRLGEMRDVLTAIELVTDSGNLKRIDASKLSFAYRYARVPKRVIVGAWFQLSQTTKEHVESLTKHYLRYRKETQPLTLPNAGSVFKNPPEQSAGSLIEQVGLKGARIGDAQISTKHGNFIVNVGHARAKDVIDLIRTVRRTVAQQTSVTLQLELKTVGEL
ncbi:MAG: UDP-N-acetylenolpyruvoylglucosamine reductase [Nitrospirales bacterium]|nr:MAG: UDP-N-acetylenolpyruvoylglucosamine reductase [Nitrospirales bacterium]